MRLKRIVLVSAMFLGATTLSWGQLTSKMTNSYHDMRYPDHSGTHQNLTGELCNTCHVPHNANSALGETPLWNHKTTTFTFPTYTGSDKFVAKNITMGQPDGASKLCLSCHDGVTAINDFGGTMGTGNYQGDSSGHVVSNSAPKPLGYWKMTFGASSGGGAANSAPSGLAATHPISFVYSSSLHTNDATINDPAVATTTLGHTIAADLLDKNGKIQCTSCHEIHDNQTNNWMLMKIANTGSALCYTCHNK